MSDDVRAPDDPIRELLRKQAEDEKRRSEEHAAVRASPAYQAELLRLDRFASGLVKTLQIGTIASSRVPRLLDESLFLRSTDDLSESTIMAAFSFREGGLNTGRRELRFMLELAIQSLFVDQQMAGAPFDHRVAFFNKKTKHNSVDHVRDLSFPMLGKASDEFVREVRSAWADASAYVHPTPQQLQAKLELRAAGVTPGCETAQQLGACTNELARVTSIIVVLFFHAIGTASSGDILVDGLDAQDAWPFHSNQFVAAVDSFFDYKHERQAVLADVVARRQRRLPL